MGEAREQVTMDWEVEKDATKKVERERERVCMEVRYRIWVVRAWIGTCTGKVLLLHIYRMCDLLVLNFTGHQYTTTMYSPSELGELLYQTSLTGG